MDKSSPANGYLEPLVAACIARSYKLTVTKKRVVIVTGKKIVSRIEIKALSDKPSAFASMLKSALRYVESDPILSKTVVDPDSR